jgi:SPW repeat
LNALLAICLLVSPWLLGTPWSSFALNIVVCGSLVLAVSVIAFKLKRSVASSWLTAVLGVWLVMSPWMFGYVASVPQAWSCIVIGGLHATVASWSLTSRAIRHS